MVSQTRKDSQKSWVIEKAGEMCALDDNVNFKRILEENLNKRFVDGLNAQSVKT